MFVVVGCVELLLEMDSIQRMLLRCCEAGEGKRREAAHIQSALHGPASARYGRRDVRVMLRNRVISIYAESSPL